MYAGYVVNILIIKTLLCKMKIFLITNSVATHTQGNNTKQCY